MHCDPIHLPKLKVKKGDYGMQRYHIMQQCPFPYPILTAFSSEPVKGLVYSSRSQDRLPYLKRHVACLVDAFGWVSRIG